MPVSCPGILYALVQLVDDGNMTEGRPLDAARVALVRDRLGVLLLEQPGAFEDYDTAVLRVTPNMWWDEKRKRIGNSTMLASLAHSWPDQPLSGKLGAYYAVSITAWTIAQRPSELPHWVGQSPASKALLKKVALQTGRTEEEMKRWALHLDDRKKRAVEELAQGACAKMRRAVLVLVSRAEDELLATRYPFGLTRRGYDVRRGLKMQGNGELRQGAKARHVERRWRAASAEFRAAEVFASN